MLVAVLLILRPVLTMHGTPELMHDWAWPVDGSGIRAMASDLSTINLRENWDAPAWLPRVHPIAPALIVASYVLSSAVLLKLFLTGILLLAAFGAYRLARALGATPFGAVLGACWYVATPFVADRLVAGHTWMLLAFAAYPLSLEAVVSRRSWGHQFFWTACTSIDIHFVGFDVLGFLLLHLTRVAALREQRGAWLGLAAFLPSLLAAPLAAQSGAFAGQNANDFYNSVNSTPLDQALRGIGYFARYDEAGRTIVQDVALWVPVGCAAAVGFWSRRLFAPLLLLLGAILASGTHGPAAVLVAWSFNAVPAASLYREFFDFVSLVCLGGALSIALAVRQPRYAVVLAALAIVAEFPQLSGAYGSLIQGYEPRGSVRAAIDQVTQSAGSSFAIAVPLQPPLSLGSFPGGVDFLGSRLGSHGTVDANHQLEPVARAVLSRPERDRGALLAAMSVGFLIDRSGWVSRAYDRLEPGFGVKPLGAHTELQELWTLREFTPAPHVRFRAANVCVAGDYGALDPARATVFSGDDASCPGVRLALHPPVTPYPKDGWVEYAPLWFIAPWGAQALPGAVFTTNAEAAFPQPEKCDPNVTYEYSGYVYRHGPAPFNRRMRGCAVQRAGAVTVLDPVVRPASVSSIGVPRGAHVREVLHGASYSVIEGSLNGPAFLQVNSRYSRLWLLIGNGGIASRSHVRADAAFNGWRITGSGEFRAAIVYAPFLVLVPLEVALLLGYVFALHAMVRSKRVAQ